MSVIEERKIRYYTNPEKKIVTAVYRDNGVEFYVNEEKRTVAAVKDNTRNFFIYFLQSIHAQIPNNRQVYKKLYMPDHFEGVAHCSPEDKFDVELGKLIAYDKLKRKLNSSFRKRFVTYNNIINENYHHTCCAVNNYITKLQNNEIYRAEIIGKRLDNQ